MKNPTILLSPGPVPLSKEVKVQLGCDMIHHRSTEITQALSRLQSYLQQIFKTKEHVYILNSTGTGAMEAALTNTLSPQDEVLVICAGKFGERWKKMAQAYQLVVHEIQVPWGQAVDISSIKEQLKKYPQIKAILTQTCETSTATLHPIQEISQLTQNRQDLLLIVDAISAFIVVDLPMDDWGMDILIGGSQKSFALPTGLSFLSFSQKAQKFQKTSQLPVFYFDLEKEKKANAKGQTAFSANVSFIRALDVQLEKYIKEGLEKVQNKSISLAQITHQLAKDLNLSLFSQSPSPSVTAIQMPDNIDGDQVKKFMKEHHVIVGGGQDHLEGKIIRFGHMGEIPTKHYLKGLIIFGKALQKQQPEIYNEKILNSALSKAKTRLQSIEQTSNV